MIGVKIMWSSIVEYFKDYFLLAPLSKELRRFIQRERLSWMGLGMLLMCLVAKLEGWI
jgi:hypothetical protein